MIEARDNARDKKAEAQRKVDALPQAQKRDLPDQLARLTGIDVPDVNDANENGVDDKVDAQREEAEHAVEAAKNADQAAQDKLKEANADGLITPDEHKALEKAAQDAADAKQNAQDKVDVLPDDQKGDMPGELDKLNGIDVPDVNDSDTNGVSDDIDEQREEAQAAVDVAKNADQAAQDKLKEANADGLITPDEHDALEKANQDAADAKKNAQEKVDALPSDQRGDMPAELDKLDGINVPDVNDSDANGVSDDVDKQREEAQAAVDAAKNADQAAQDKLKEANADGLITPDEHEALEKANQDAADAKQNAKTKVDGLPSDQRGDMPSELDKLHGIDIPDVNDSDANGVSDDVDAQREEAQAAVNAAKSADQAAQNKLKEANADGLITPDEHDALVKANQEAAEAKQNAQEKVDGLPSEQRGDMPSELDKLHGIDIPDVNDSDSNGVSDDVDQQREEAQAAVDAAKNADQAAQDKLKEANADGLITPDEHDALEKANQEAAEAKQNAQNKVDALPSDQRGDMPSELNQLHGIDIPDVNDSDANGVADSIDEQRNEAQQAIDAAKRADQIAQDKLKEAQADGIITPDEHDELEKANQDAANAKQVAQDKVNTLPDTQKAILQPELDALHGIEVPRVSEQEPEEPEPNNPDQPSQPQPSQDHSDDVHHSTHQDQPATHTNDQPAGNTTSHTRPTVDQAQHAVDQAQQEDHNAKEKLQQAMADQVITTDEQHDLAQAQQSVIAAKQEAQAQIDQQPAQEQSTLQAELDTVTNIEIPSTGAHPVGTTPQSPSHTTSQDEDALPDTGEQATSQGTILGSMAALIGSLFLFRKRRKHKDEQ
ncbi:gram positive anchor [Staphylococcus pettenkoferi VCU012]|nr:LPXTG cell wall anchor domain-containing protein [Staphylococcus pettenkoferi]EHM72636.1 gram positive anchor [Staphylococcus pettenkoferi VCU012]